MPNRNSLVYFKFIFLNFRFQHEKDLIEKFKKEKEPTKFFRFFRYIWFPKNYIIEKSTYTNDVNLLNHFFLV